MDLKDVKKLIDIAIKSDLAEFEYTEGEIKIRIVRGTNPQIQIPIAAPTMIPGQIVPQQITTSPNSTTSTNVEPVTQSQAVEDHYEQITSPMVGTFYRAPAPDADPYVENGSTIESDQTVCIIEAMKLMNEIKAEFKCKIIEVLVENAHAVEFGQPLFKVQRL